ncbi:MAG: carbonic anhydrase [Betaproteobacteria bacterium]|nr:carbonic anhydrase [Betaproteobacteria bacterium]
MKKILFFALPFAAAIFAQSTQAAEPAGHPHPANEPPHWGYDGDGAPEHWGQLSPEFAMCSIGVNQTPINIEGALNAGVKPLKLHYKNGSQTIVNNGHTVQVNVAAGNTLNLDDKTFELQQFHFHTPSENLVNGKSFPLEAHFVYKNSEGELAVLALMFKEGKTVNKQLEEIWKVMPKEKGEPVALAKEVDVQALLPKHRAYYRFSGSLTTPPCTEGVRWLVLKDALSISKEQVEQFSAVVHHHNNRPVQPLYGRVIVQ